MPPEGHKLLVIGTSSNMEAMESLGISEVFNEVKHVPTLSPEDLRHALELLDAFEPSELDAAVKMMGDEMPIKRLFLLLEQARHSGPKGAQVAGRIPLSRFLDCMTDSSLSY